MIDGFLEFLGRDMEAHPERISTVPVSLFARAQELWAKVSIDHDAPIEGAIEL